MLRRRRVLSTADGSDLILGPEWSALMRFPCPKVSVRPTLVCGCPNFKRYFFSWYTQRPPKNFATDGSGVIWRVRRHTLVIWFKLEGFLSITWFQGSNIRPRVYMKNKYSHTNIFHCFLFKYKIDLSIIRPYGIESKCGKQWTISSTWKSSTIAIKYDMKATETPIISFF